MKKKSNSKKTKLEIDSLENTLFRNLTNEESEGIKGGVKGILTLPPTPINLDSSA